MTNFQLAVSPLEAPPIDIGLVERETGVPKDTLRIWERRYGFPTPVRSIAGRRGYSRGDVIKLRLLKRLIDQGYRPKTLLSQPVDALRALVETVVAKADGISRRHSQIQLPVDLLTDDKLEELSHWIASAFDTLDARSFILDCVRPLCQQIGEAWADTRLSIAGEHIITEKLQSILRQMIAAARYSTSRPKVVLTTPPGEKHGLGLLMVRALLSCDGVGCVSLGTETPVDEIAKCVDLTGANIVGVSISSSFGKKAAVRFLVALRNALPPTVDLWAGGMAVCEISMPIIGVRFLPALESMATIFGRSSIDA